MNASPLRLSFSPLLLALLACGPSKTLKTVAGARCSPFEAAKTCHGDELQYDSNAFAASLAVATANELGRWTRWATSR